MTGMTHQLELLLLLVMAEEMTPSHLHLMIQLVRGFPSHEVYVPYQLSAERMDMCEFILNIIWFSSKQPNIFISNISMNQIENLFKEETICKE